MIALAQLPGTVQNQHVPDSTANTINSSQPQATHVNLAVSGNTNATSTTLPPALNHSPASPNLPRPQGVKWWSEHHLTARGAGWSAVFLGVLGLWIAFQSLHETKKANILADYANLASFRDDCRAQNDTGYGISNACQEALAKPLPPPHQPRDTMHSVSQTYTVCWPLPVKGNEVVYTASIIDSINSTSHVPLRRSHEGRVASRHSKGDDLDRLSDWNTAGQYMRSEGMANSAGSFVSVGSWAVDDPIYDSQQIKNQDLRFVDELLKMKIVSERY